MTSSTPSRSSEPSARGQHRRGEWALLVGCAGIAVAVISVEGSAMGEAAQAALPWLWGSLVGGLLLVGLTAVGIQRLRGHLGAPGTLAPRRGVRRGAWRAAVLVILLLVAAFSMNYLEFPVPAVGVLAVSAGVLGVRPWWAGVLFGAVLVGAVWLLLTQVLGQYLPLWPGW